MNTIANKYLKNNVVLVVETNGFPRGIVTLLDLGKFTVEYYKHIDNYISD
jgi:hypothetical protein